jgi:methyl-accepting chemotaxis protein
VRSLAQRSAAAAKEIKALIDNSVQKADAGSRLVDQAGTTMRDVVESIRRVADIMGEISAASQEQTEGIGQVQLAISQMDQTTQQNAALVEEAAAASEQLREQAAKLAQTVSVFKLGGAHDRAAPVSAVQPRQAAPAIAPPVRKTPAAPARAPAQPPRARHVAGAGADEEWQEF